MPAGANPSDLAYLCFTWDTIGVIDRSSLINFTSEAWVRNPTTPGQVPVPPAPPNPPPNPPPLPPDPIPTPTPTPTPVPATTLFIGFDEAHKTIYLPPGYSAKSSIYPEQINAHIGPAKYVAIPKGWTAVMPLAGVETMP